MGIQINGQTGRITRPDGNVKIPNSDIGISQLTVANGASVTGIMTVTAGVGKTITLDPSQKMLTLGDTTMHQDSGTGDTILMRDGAYNPFRASRFLIDDVTVIDANRNFIGAAGTFTGNVSVGGVLTYEDVTNVDSIGIVTAREGIRVPNDKWFGLGDPGSFGNGEFRIRKRANDQAIIQNENGDFVIDNQVNSSSNYIRLQGKNTAIEGRYGGQTIAKFIDGGASELNYNGNKKLETTSAGLTIYGEIVSTNGTLRRDVSDSSFTVTGDTASNTGANINLYGASHSSLANVFRVRAGSTERLRITSAGQLLVGATAARTDFATTPHVQIEGLDFPKSSLSITRNDNSNGRPTLFFGKSRGTTDGATTVVADGDGLGTIEWAGADGDQLIRAAYVAAQVDGTPTNNGMPGRLVFSTNSGGTVPTERLRITNDGHVLIGKNSTNYDSNNRFVLAIGGGSNALLEMGHSTTTDGFLYAASDEFRVSSVGSIPLRFDTDSTERVRIGSGGEFAIGTAAINANFAVGGAPGGGTGQLNVYTSSSGGWAAQMRNDHANGNGLFIRGGGDAAGEYPLYVTNNDENNAILIVTGDQKVGILQTSPNNVLDIGGVGTNGLSVRMGGSGYSTLFRYGSNEDNYISQGPSGQTIFRDREADEHVRIDSAGRMGLNCPGQDLSAFNANGSQDLVIFSRGSSGLSAHAGITLHGGSTTASQCSLTFADGNAGAQRYAGSIDYLHSVDALSFRVATTGAMRIDSSHRLMMGTTTSVHTYRKIQVVGSYSGTAQRQGALLRYGEASSNGPVLTFEKNRSNSGGTSSVASDDALGEIHFQGTDQAGSYRLSSMIRGEAATTPASNRVAGQIKFYCDSGSSLNETVRITRHGRTQASKEFAIRNSAGYGNGRNSRVEYIQGGNGTYSTCTVTINQNSYGSLVYDIKVHGYASSTVHVAGGYYQNGSIYNDSKSINHVTSGVSVTGPTAAGGQTATFVFSRTNGWVHPICSISISSGGDSYIDDSDITIVWS